MRALPCEFGGHMSAHFSIRLFRKHRISVEKLCSETATVTSLQFHRSRTVSDLSWCCRCHWQSSRHSGNINKIMYLADQAEPDLENPTLHSSFSCCTNSIGVPYIGRFMLVLPATLWTEYIALKCARVWPLKSSFCPFRESISTFLDARRWRRVRHICGGQGYGLA